MEDCGGENVASGNHDSSSTIASTGGGTTVAVDNDIPLVIEVGLPFCSIANDLRESRCLSVPTWDEFFLCWRVLVVKNRVPVLDAVISPVCLFESDRSLIVYECSTRVVTRESFGFVICFEGGVETD